MLLSFSRFILALGGLIVVITIGVQVLMRYVFESPLYGIEEFSRIIALWVYFIAVSLALHAKSHISADIRDQLSLSVRSRLVTSVISALIITITSSILVFFTVKYTYWSYSGGQTTPGLWWPRYILIGSSAVGSIAMTIISVFQLIKELKLLGANLR